MGGSEQTIEGFLASREGGVPTGSDHPPITLRFEIEGYGHFIVTLSGAWAFLEPSGDPDLVVRCSQEEFLGLVTGEHELIGPFWRDHLPVDECSYAPSLYAFLYPDHPYASLNPVLGTLYRTSRYYPMVTPFPQGYRLYSLVTTYRLELTLEIGLAFGGSAIFMCTAHKTKGHGQHFAIDPFQMHLFGGEGLELVERAGLASFLRWLPATAQVAMSGLRKAGVTFDLIYIDGDHGRLSVMCDFLKANALLRVDGVLAFDDSHMPSGQQVLARIERSFGYERLDQECTDRLTVLRKIEHNEGSALDQLLTRAGWEIDVGLSLGRMVKR